MYSITPKGTDSRHIFRIDFAFQFDLESSTWSDDPSPVISSLQAMVAAAKTSTKFEEKKPNSNKSVEDKFDSLKSHITGKWTKTILKFMLPRIHNLVAVRERAKSMLIKR